MNASFTRRLALLSAGAIASGFVVVVVASLLWGFSFYVANLMRDLNEAALDVHSILTSNGPPPDDAVAAARELTQRFFRPQVQVIVFDARRRVVIRRHADGASTYETYSVSGRNTLPNDLPQGVAARSTMALATIFGLQPVGVHAGPLLVVVRADAGAVGATLGRYVPVVAFALVLACALGLGCGRMLAEAALRPLHDVTAALQRFAAGDRTPRAIAASDGQQLSDLAQAYNGAIAEVERAFAERERAQDAMRQFMTDAGHQLRTPLTVIRGFIRVLRREDACEPSDRERILDTMNRQSLLMASLIDNLILLDRWERPADATVDVVDVSRLTEDVVTPIAEAHPERRLHLAVAPGLLVRIDPGDLTHAITNLVDNALKYAPTGAIEVVVAPVDGVATIAVTDAGPGMTADEQLHAFDRFYRGPHRRDVPGSGLGLAIARRAVERAGGTLAIETPSVGGTRFTISLPRIEQPVVIPSLSRERDRLPIDGNRTITPV